jgi:hypothetical protein
LQNGDCSNPFIISPFGGGARKSAPFFLPDFSPEKNSANFLGTGPHKGAKALCMIQTPFHIPRKALRNPRKSLQALQGVQSLHRTKNRHQIGSFQLSAPLGHQHTDMKRTILQFFLGFFAYFTYLCRRNTE